jgi:hypothetical protein
MREREREEWRVERDQIFESIIPVSVLNESFLSIAQIIKSRFLLKRLKETRGGEENLLL